MSAVEKWEIKNESSILFVNYLYVDSLFTKVMAVDKPRDDSQAMPVEMSDRENGHQELTSALFAG